MMKGTMYATLHALCGVSPLCWTRESNTAGITKLEQVLSQSVYALEQVCLLCNPPSCIAPAGGQCIGSSYNLLVEEACSPDLARYETGAENTDKKSQSD
jgi:hypothetical protein